MSSIVELAGLLVGALTEPAARAAHLRQFQNAVSDASETEEPCAAWEALTELATDLEHYVADPVSRADHSSYFGDEQLRREILYTLRALVESGAIPVAFLKRAATEH